MSVATLRSEPETDATIHTHGAASVAFARDDDVTRLTGLYQRDPLRVLFPDVPEGEIPTAVLVTTSGGLVGGDRLDVSVAVGDGAEAMMFGQAAEKVYRSAGPTSRIAVELSVGRDGWLEWLPQETILFEGARLERRTLIEIAPGARALAGEILVFGRIAGGERLSRGLVRDAGLCADQKDAPSFFLRFFAKGFKKVDARDPFRQRKAFESGQDPDSGGFRQGQARVRENLPEFRVIPGFAEHQKIDRDDLKEPPAFQGFPDPADRFLPADGIHPSAQKA